MGKAFSTSRRGDRRRDAAAAGLSLVVRAALNLVFAAAIWSVLARGIEIDCGCYGLLADKLGLPDAADGISVVRNLVFAGASLFLVTCERTPFSLGKPLGAA